MEPRLFEKTAPEMKQTKYKMSLEYLVPDSKEVSKEWWKHVKRTQEPAWRDSTSQIWNNINIKYGKRL